MIGAVRWRLVVSHSPCARRCVFLWFTLQAEDVATIEQELQDRYLRLTTEHRELREKLAAVAQD